jgi:hypothetical protein
MNVKHEGSSLAGWLIELGGGRDPSWAASITRTLAAAGGLAALYYFNIDYDYLTFPARLGAGIATSLFGASLVIKGIKWAVDEIQLEARMKLAQIIWESLTVDELQLVYRFIRERQKRLNAGSESVTDAGASRERTAAMGLIQLGGVKDIGISTGEVPGRVLNIEIDRGLLELALHKWKSGDLRAKLDAEAVAADQAAKIADLEQQIQQAQNSPNELTKKSVAALKYSTANELRELDSQTGDSTKKIPVLQEDIDAMPSFVAESKSVVITPDFSGRVLIYDKKSKTTDVMEIDEFLEPPKVSAANIATSTSLKEALVEATIEALVANYRLTRPIDSKLLQLVEHRVERDLESGGNQKL